MNSRAIDRYAAMPSTREGIGCSAWLECHCGKKLKNTRQRLCGECSCYFKLWGQIRELRGWPNDDEHRYAWHELAGLPAGKSHAKFAHGEFTRLFNWTRLQLAGDSNLNAAMDAANPEIGERRELVRGIEQRMRDDYLRPILDAQGQYRAFVESRGWRAWRDLPMGLLRALHITVVNRSRANEREAAEGVRNDGIPF